MDAQELQQPQHHQVVMNRFVAASLADERVVAAFLGGSYARGTADAYSDLDLYLITTDEAYENFTASREAFLRLLGEPVFLEDVHEKVEQAIAVEQLAPLQATFCPLERGAMLQAALLIVRFYRELAPPLAWAHEITYPADLERVMSDRLEKLCNTRLN